MKITFEEACAFLREHDNFIILTHRGPDGDTLGSAYSLERVLRKFGKTAYVRLCDKLPKKYTMMAEGAHPIPDGFTPDCVIAVDVAENTMLGSLSEEYKGKVDLCIDHHVSNSDYAKLTYVNAKAAATGEIIYDIALALPVEVDVDIAKRLYVSLVTDTGSFKFSNTTPRTLIIASELISFGFDFTAIHRNMLDLKTWNQMQLEKSVLSTLTLYDGGVIAVIYVTQQMMDETGTSSEDLEGLAQLPRYVEGTKVGITIKQSGENNWRISLRSGVFDASEACKVHGGGGHPRAAGCELQGTLEEVRETFLTTIRSFLKGVNLK